MSMMQPTAAFRSRITARPVADLAARSGVDNIFSHRFDPTIADADHAPVTREELVALFPDLLGLAGGARVASTARDADNLLAAKARAGRLLALAAAARGATPRPVARIVG